MPRDADDIFSIAASLAACLVAAGLFLLFGFIGVGILGLLVLGIATQVELEDGRGIGGGNATSLYAQWVQNEERQPRAEQAELRQERRKRHNAVRHAQMFGLALLVIGGAGFAFIDLHLTG